MSEKAVIILSGGMDSVVLLHYLIKKLNKKVHALSFDYGQKHNIELEMAKKNIEELKENIVDWKILDITFMKELLKGSNALTDDNIEVPTLEEVIGEPQPITYVPMRNLMFLTLASAYAEAVGASDVYYGAQKHDEYSGYWDTTSMFRDKLNDVLTLDRKNTIKIKAPFVNLHKSEEVILGNDLGVDFSKTWTSYKVIDIENLIADIDNPTSRDRIKAFAEAGIPDPQKYNKEINWEELFEKYKKDFTVEEVSKKLVL